MGKGARGCDDIQLRQVLPKELSAIEHPSSADVEEIYRQHAILVVIAEDIGIIAFNSCDALFFLQLLDSRDQITILGRTLVLLCFRGLCHALAQRTQKIGWPAFEKKLHVPHRFLIDLRTRQPLHAWPETAFDVVLQTRSGMISTKVDFA